MKIWSKKTLFLLLLISVPLTSSGCATREMYHLTGHYFEEEKLKSVEILSLYENPKNLVQFKGMFCTVDNNCYETFGDWTKVSDLRDNWSANTTRTLFEDSVPISFTSSCKLPSSCSEPKLIIVCKNNKTSLSFFTCVPAAKVFNETRVNYSTIDVLSYHWWRYPALLAVLPLTIGLDLATSPFQIIDAIRGLPQRPIYY